MIPEDLGSLAVLENQRLLLILVVLEFLVHLDFPNFLQILFDLENLVGLHYH